MAFQGSDQSMGKTSQSELMTQRGSHGSFFRGCSSRDGSIKRLQILTEPPGDPNALVTREKVGQHSPQLLRSIQNGGALTRLEFRPNIDHQLVLLDQSGGMETGIRWIRHRVTPMVHGVNHLLLLRFSFVDGDAAVYPAI